MSENVITPEITARNEREEGGYTYDSFPPDGFEGRIFVFAVLGLGNHAHVQVSSAFWHAGEFPKRNPGAMGLAGTLILGWRDWLRLRDILEPRPDVRVAEVQNASLAQLIAHGIGESK